jgi:hypothetical protein
MKLKRTLCVQERKRERKRGKKERKYLFFLKQGTPTHTHTREFFGQKNKNKKI